MEKEAQKNSRHTRNAKRQICLREEKGRPNVKRIRNDMRTRRRPEGTRRKSETYTQHTYTQRRTPHTATTPPLLQLVRSLPHLVVKIVEEVPQLSWIGRARPAAPPSFAAASAATDSPALT